MNVKAILLACAVLAGCAPPGPQGEPVSPEAYVSLIRGNTQVGTSTAGGSWRMYIADDLSRRGTVFLPGRQVTVTGRVAATDQGFCSSAPEIRNGETRCFQILRNGENFQSIYNGAVDSTSRIVPGNPYNL